MGHGDDCFGMQFRDDFVFEPVGIVVGGLAEPTGSQGNAGPVEAPDAIGASSKTHRVMAQGIIGDTLWEVSY